MTDTKQVDVQVKTRNKRKPFGVPRSKLDVPYLPSGMTGRWVNDEPGRIAQAIEGDYRFATPEEVGLPANKESRVKILGGTQKDGSQLDVYLMLIPTEYAEEDKAEKNRYLDQIDDAIRGGTMDRTSNDGRYVPKDGIKISTK
jgi:hypothetical protein